MKPLYKSAEAKTAILNLYQEKLDSLNIEYQNIDIKTSYGRTRVIKTGNPNGKPVVIFHGINAGAPIALEAVKGLRDDHLLYAIDTIGQTTMSVDNRINILDDSYAKWMEETLNGLALSKADFIGVSYGAYILQRLISYRPDKVDKSIFVVPSGLVNGKMWPSLKLLTLPLIKFLITKKDQHLRQFLSVFVPEDDEYMFRLQKLLLLGTNMDYRRPKLLQKEDVMKYQGPVYMIVADNDVFFPGEEAVQRAKEIFNNLREVHTLSNSLHITHKSNLHIIQDKILKWLKE